MAEKVNKIYIARQPILDYKSRLVAYELLFRENSSCSVADVRNATQATIQVMENAASIGIYKIVGPHRAFINCNREILLSDVLKVLDPKIYVLEILEDVEIDDTIAARIKELRAQDFTIALDDFVYDNDNMKRAEKVMDDIRIIKADLSLIPLQAWKQCAEYIKTHKKRGLAEKVETWSVFDDCKTYGYQYFQGYFFAKPELLTANRIDAKTMEIMQVLTELRRKPDIAVLDAAFKQSPALTIKMLSFINSAYIGLQTTIQSIRQAIMMFGTEKLERWLSLLLYAKTGPDGGFDIGGSVLFENASQRALLMENIIKLTSPKDREKQEKAYLTGVLSHLDVLLRMPMSAILDDFKLDPNISEAILKNEGELGQVLSLVKMQETDEGDKISEMLEQLNLVEDSYKQALLDSYGKAI